MPALISNEQQRSACEETVVVSLLRNKHNDQEPEQRSRLWLVHELLTHPWRYAIGTLLMLSTFAMFVVPGAMPAVLLTLLLSSGLNMMAACALFCMLAAVLAFFAPVITGWTLKLLGVIIETAPIIVKYLLGLTSVMVTAIVGTGAVISAFVAYGTALLALLTAFLTSVIGNILSGNGFSGRLCIDTVGGNGNYQDSWVKRHWLLTVVSFTGKLIGIPLRALAYALEFALYAAVALTIISAIIALAIAIIPLVLTCLVGYAAWSAAKTLVESTGRLLSRLGRVCLGEDFHIDSAIPTPIKQLDEKGQRFINQLRETAADELRYHHPLVDKLADFIIPTSPAPPPAGPRHNVFAGPTSMSAYLAGSSIAPVNNGEAMSDPNHTELNTAG